MSFFIQIIVSGLTLGAMYAIAAVGLALVWGSFKLVAPAGRRPNALFDVAADPGETKDVAAEHPVLAAALRGELARWIAEGVAKAGAGFTPDAELERELRELGYVGGEK